MPTTVFGWGAVVRFRMLGNLQVWDGTAWSSVRADQPRIVLAVFLTEAGRVVSTDRLVDEIWGERPPRAAVATVQGYVSRLRRLLGPGAGGPLVTRGRGYELAVRDGDLDVEVFERLVESGRRSLADGGMEAAVARLSEALALWDGPALADVPPTPTVAAQVTRLEQSRLDALEERLGALLELGRHAEAVGELGRLVDEHPLRERLWARFMLALHRCGRRAEALMAYQRARQMLVAELGVEPGPELRRMQKAILDDAPDLAGPVQLGFPTVRQVPPAQLPAGVTGFTGRGAYLRRLDAMVAQTGTVVIVAVDGTAGVGKTALAVHWAHRVADRFPDGQLYANLRGYATDPPLRPIDVLAQFLPALGVPAEEVPDTVEQAATLYRSVLAGKRMLILLDNACHPDQVRQVLPGSAGSLVVVTSRDQLRGLVARDGATRIDLDVLTPAEAETLLARLLTAGRMDATNGLGELAHLCGYLPLALRIAAANLTAQPRSSISDYIGRLRPNRLAALQVDGDPRASVRAAFDLSYAALPVDARRLFRLIGLHPGPDITAEAAAALADLPPALTAQLLDRLTAAHLADQHAPGRYALHDLLRHYGTERALADDSELDRRAALDRLNNHYLHLIDAAATQLYPQVLRLPPPSSSPTAHQPGRFRNHTQGRAWLDAERPNLIAAVTRAAEQGPPQVAWRLADALRGYLMLGRHTVDWQTVADAGLAAAVADGDLRAQVAARRSLAMLCCASGRYPEAIDHYGQALDQARRAGWPQGESAVLHNIGAIHFRLGRLDDAAEHYRRALAINRQTRRRAGQAVNLGHLGLVYGALGQLELAATHHAEALTISRQAGLRIGEANALACLGDTWHALGRLDAALAALTDALALHRELGDRHHEADTTRLVATLHRDAGRYEQALDLAGTALELSRHIGDLHAQAQALTVQASVHQLAGRIEQAIEGHRRALTLAHQTGHRYTHAEVLVGLAAAVQRTSDLRQATDHAVAAFNIAHEHKYRLLEAQAGTVLATIHLHQGRPHQALDHAEKAIAIHTNTGHRIGLATAHLASGHALYAIGHDGAARTHQRRADRLFTAIGASAADHARALLGLRTPLAR